MRNIKLTLEYDGTAFHGWQVQPNKRTVQGLLVESLRTLLQEPVSVIGAGRTDAGVHARGQVANFTTQNKLPLREIHHRLNALLPPDVVVHHIRKVPLGFHARYDAICRRYLYCLSTCPTALRRHVVWSVPYAIDATLMRDAAQGLLGTHDFSSFCIGSDQRAHCRCTVQEVSLKNRKGEIHFQIAANRFLHAMVRFIMGELVEVGRGRRSQKEFLALVRKGNKQHRVVVAPPQGLCLLEVAYPRTSTTGKEKADEILHRHRQLG